MAAILGAFLRLSRLKFLAGGIIGAAFGTAIARYERGSLDAGAWAVAQLAITAIQLMTHYANEFFDRAGDALGGRTAFSGGSGVLVEGLLPPGAALGAAGACGALGATAAAALAVMGHPLAAALATACLVLAWAYSAPPVRLLARALGEADTAIVVGVLVPLCAYAAQTGSVDARAVASTLPAAAAMFAMMLSVEVPDVAADAACGKRNLVVRMGTRAAGGLGLATIAAAVCGVGLAISFGAPARFGALEVVAAAPGAALAGGFGDLLRGRPLDAAALAARGVLAFITVAAAGAAGYALSAAN